MKSKYHFSFEKLDVYQKALVFGDHVQLVIKTFPRDELYALSSQFRKAADSTVLNIAEGYPGSDAQFIKHLNYSIYSANECVVCGTKAYRRNYVTFDENEFNRKSISELTKMLASLREHVRSRNK